MGIWCPLSGPEHAQRAVAEAVAKADAAMSSDALDVADAVDAQAPVVVLQRATYKGLGPLIPIWIFPPRSRVLDAIRRLQDVGITTPASNSRGLYDLDGGCRPTPKEACSSERP